MKNELKKVITTKEGVFELIPLSRMNDNVCFSVKFNGYKPISVTPNEMISGKFDEILKEKIVLWFKEIKAELV